jgi:hypothetical protein
MHGDQSKIVKNRKIISSINKLIKPIIMIFLTPGSTVYAPRGVHPSVYALWRMHFIFVWGDVPA